MLVTISSTLVSNGCSGEGVAIITGIFTISIQHRAGFTSTAKLNNRCPDNTDHSQPSLAIPANRRGGSNSNAGPNLFY